jgi:hypothetical protein
VVRERVPWRVVDGKLVPVHGRVRGRVTHDGAYELELKPGTYKLGAQSDEVGAFARERPIEVVEGDQRLDLNLDLGASVSGKVVDEDGHPVEGAVVVFQCDALKDSGHAFAAADGTFTARSMSGGGDYRIQVARHVRTGPLPFAGGEPPTVHLDDGRSQVSGVNLVVKLPPASPPR